MTQKSRSHHPGQPHNRGRPHQQNNNHKPPSRRPGNHRRRGNRRHFHRQKENQHRKRRCTTRETLRRRMTRVMGVATMLLVAAWGTMRFIHRPNVSGERPEAPLELSDVIDREIKLQSQLGHFVDMIETIPPMSNKDFEEVHRLRAYYRGRLVRKLPTWLQSHGYELPQAGRQELDELNREWLRLQSDYANFGQQSLSKTGVER